MKKYCDGFTKNVDEETGELINEFCKYYNGPIDNLESCAYKCSNGENPELLEG